LPKLGKYSFLKDNFEDTAVVLARKEMKGAHLRSLKSVYFKRKTHLPKIKIRFSGEVEKQVN